MDMIELHDQKGMDWHLTIWDSSSSVRIVYILVTMSLENVSGGIILVHVIQRHLPPHSVSLLVIPLNAISTHSTFKIQYQKPEKQIKVSKLDAYNRKSKFVGVTKTPDLESRFMTPWQRNEAYLFELTNFSV